MRAAANAADALDAVHDAESAEAAADAYIAFNNEFAAFLDAATH